MSRLKVSTARKSLFLLLAAAALLLIGLPFVTANDESLFLDAPGSVITHDTAVSQAKYVAINWSVLEDSHTGQIRINLFDGEVLTAVHDQTYPSSVAGGFAWVGHLLHKKDSTVTLSTVDDILIGSIVIEGIEQYRIGYDGRRQVLQENEAGILTEIEGPDTVMPPAMAAQTDDTADFCEDGSRIDLLVAYTPAALNRVGDKAAIEALINQRVADMNTANRNSGLGFSYRLVHVMQTNYPETGDVKKDLDRLVNGTDGRMDDVLIARDQHLADMTALLIAESTVNNSCGVAYVMNSPSSGFADFALNVTALDYVGSPTCSSLTLAHEFGHNMGNQHDREHTGNNPIYPYSFGYQSPSKTFRTIMAYQCSGANCPRIIHWSNPDINFAGEPTGIDYAVDRSNAADNARSMKKTAPIVANFRQNCTAPPTPSATPVEEPAASPTPTATPSATHTPTNTATAVPSATNTPAAVETTTPTLSPTATRSEGTATPQAVYRVALPLVIGQSR